MTRNRVSVESTLFSTTPFHLPCLLSGEVGRIYPLQDTTPVMVRRNRNNFLNDSFYDLDFRTHLQGFVLSDLIHFLQCCDRIFRILLEIDHSESLWFDGVIPLLHLFLFRLCTICMSDSFVYHQLMWGNRCIVFPADLPAQRSWFFDRA